MKLTQQPTIKSVKRKRVKSGFTLVELLCCLAFLSLAVYPMLSCITYSIKSVLRAQDQMMVMGLVQDAIENQRATAYTSALTPGTTSTTSTPTGMLESVTVTTTIALVSGYTDLYSVQVTGTWQDASINGTTGTITVTTYMRAPHV